MSWEAEGLLEKALVAVRNQDYERALALLVATLGVDSKLVEAWVLRGNILIAQERWFEALLHFDRALEVNPKAWDAWCNRGAVLGHLGRWQEAEIALRRSISIMNSREPHMSLASTFCTLMRLEEAAEEYRAAIKLDPFDYEARFNLGTVLLGLGEWKEGFEQYEARHLNDLIPPAAARCFPRWNGEYLVNKTLLLYPEQGYGDEIMAARFASWMAARYRQTKVILEVRHPFARLARSLPFIENIVTRGDLYPEGIDYSCSTLDVPGRLEMGWGDIPRGAEFASYLKAPQLWAHPLAALQMPKGFNIGLCWGSGRHLSTSLAARAVKSIPIHKLKPLAMPGVNLISLQKPAELTPPEMQVYDWTDELHDLADTAILIAGLDLVITVDTAVAHLAGALGKPVWNLVRFSGYWPWLARKDDYSIWYPSMKLYRQPALGDWETPINRAVNDLSALLAERKAA